MFHSNSNRIRSHNMSTPVLPQETLRDERRLQQEMVLNQAGILVPTKIISASTSQGQGQDSQDYRSLQHSALSSVGYNFNTQQKQPISTLSTMSNYSGVSGGSNISGGSIILKTPVSLLNEVCAKAKMTPVFACYEEGPPHARVFECVVKMDAQGVHWEGKGQAKAKKDAKQEAAKALLLSMDAQADQLMLPTTKEEAEEAPQPPGFDCDPEVEGNPVGELNDLCMKLKRSSPEYQEVGEEGKPHEKVYTIQCKLLGCSIAEEGRARSKKGAKRIAAYKVKVRLMEMMANKSSAGDTTDGSPPESEAKQQENETTLVEQIFSQLSVKKKSTKKQGPFQLKQWISEFKARTGEKLSSLQDETKTTAVCPAKLLKEIAEEQKFKIEYVDIEGKGEEELNCIMSIGIEPIAIFMGAGSSKTQARKAASARAIEFLKVAVNPK